MQGDSPNQESEKQAQQDAVAISPATKNINRFRTGRK